MSSLKSLLETKHATVGAELSAFIETTVAEQKGISGMALKGAIGAAKTVNGDIVTKAANRLLPEVIEVLDPYWTQFEESGDADFGVFLAGHKAEVSSELLVMADRNAEKIDVPALKKAYSSLRGKAAGFIEPNVEGLGRIMQNHM